MKVHLYGNVLNNSFNFTKFLRAKGIDAQMFLDDYSNFEQDYPWREDSSLSPDNLPDWIHYYKFKPSKLDFHFPDDKFQKLINDFSQCDVALVNGLGPIIAMKAKVPYFFYSIGSCLDIAMVGFRIRLGIRNLLKLKKPAGLLTGLILGPLQKKAIRNANRVGVLMGYQLNTHAKSLGVLDKVELMRLPWDIKEYESKVNVQLQKKYEKLDLVYFMPTRHIWSSLWGYDFCKGNDKFIRAFARLIQDQKPNARLVCVEKGHDVIESKKLISDLGIQDNVEWITELNKDGIKMYNSLTNVVVVDQFGHDDWKQRWPDNDHFGIGFSGIGYEAVSAKNILISTFTDTQFYDGSIPPMFEAFTTDEIYTQLVKITALSKAERDEIGEAAYQFCYKYHNWDATSDLYINVLRKIHAEYHRP